MTERLYKAPLRTVLFGKQVSAGSVHRMEPEAADMLVRVGLLVAVDENGEEVEHKIEKSEGAGEDPGKSPEGGDNDPDQTGEETQEGGDEDPDAPDVTAEIEGSESEKPKNSKKK